LKEEAPDSILWRTRFARGKGPVARQNTIGDDKYSGVTNHVTLHLDICKLYVKFV
jgi:hypothetical protein